MYILCPYSFSIHPRFIWFCKKQDTHGPHCSPEKPVQINRHFWAKLWIYIKTFIWRGKNHKLKLNWMTLGQTDGQKVISFQLKWANKKLLSRNLKIKLHKHKNYSHNEMSELPNLNPIGLLRLTQFFNPLYWAMMGREWRSFKMVCLIAIFVIRRLTYCGFIIVHGGSMFVDFVGYPYKCSICLSQSNFKISIRGRIKCVFEEANQELSCIWV